MRRSSVAVYFGRPSRLQLRQTEDLSPVIIVATSSALGVQIAPLHPVPAKPPGPAGRARSAPHAVERRE